MKPDLFEPRELSCEDCCHYMEINDVSPCINCKHRKYPFSGTEWW